MRIHTYLAGGQVNPITKGTVETLLKLLSQQGSLRGIVKRLTPASFVLFVQNGDAEVELPLPSRDHFLVPGQVVELSQEGEGVALKILPEQPSVRTSVEQQGVHLKQLEQVLREINVPPTQEAVQVAQGLLERGFPLQEKLIWLLLPWAEKGQLEEALLLLQARFPVKPELLAMVRQLQSRSPREAILTEVRDSLPSDLQRVLDRPSLASRSDWSRKTSDGEAFKALTRLLVEERFVESLLAQELHPPQSEYIFALPFLLADDLQAAWVRISRDEGSSQEGDGKPEEFLIRFEIPTSTLGLVGAELLIRGKNVSITLTLGEQPECLVEALEELGQELGSSGWSLGSLKVRGWDDAQGRSITL